MGKIHAATKKSPRLRKVLKAMGRKRWTSTFALMMETRLCAVSTAIQELRAIGYNIETRQVGHGKFEYRRV